MNDTVYILTSSGELYHHGVKGMKWGVRRYQKKIDKYRKKAKEYDKYSKEYAKEGSRRYGSDGERQTDQEITWMKKLAADNKAKSQKYEAKAQKIEAKMKTKAQTTTKVTRNKNIERAAMLGGIFVASAIAGYGARTIASARQSMSVKSYERTLDWMEEALKNL